VPRTRRNREFYERIKREVVGIVFAVGAWFALTYKPKPQAPAANDRESSPAAKS